MIDWTDPDYVQNKQFYALVKKVTVKCGDAPPATAKGYVYNPKSTEAKPTVSFTSKSTTLDAPTRRDVVIPKVAVPVKKKNGVLAMFGTPDMGSMGFLIVLVAGLARATHFL